MPLFGSTDTIRDGYVNTVDRRMEDFLREMIVLSDMTREHATAVAEQVDKMHRIARSD